MAAHHRLLAVLLALIPFTAYGASPSLQVKIDTGMVEGKASGPVRAFLGSLTLRLQLGNSAGNLPHPQLNGQEFARLTNLGRDACRVESIPIWSSATRA